MPTVEKTSGGRVVVRGIGEFDPGDRVEVSDADAQYLVEERGDFEVIDGDDETDDAAEEADDSDVAIATGDAEAFVDRTPMEDVVEDIEDGVVDEVLDQVEAAAERKGVLEAIEARRDELEQEG